MPESDNLLLASLSQEDRALLKPHLKPVTLEQHTVLYNPGDAVNAVYFPTDAVISLVVTLSTCEMIEAAMVGRDGVVGASAALDGRISLSRAIVQLGWPWIAMRRRSDQARRPGKADDTLAAHPA